MNTGRSVAIVAPQWLPLPAEGVASANEFMAVETATTLSHLGYGNSLYSISPSANNFTKVNGNTTYDYTPVSRIDEIWLRKLTRLFTPNYTQSLVAYLPYILKVACKIRAQKSSVVHVFQSFPFCFWIKLLNPLATVIYHVSWHGLGKNGDYYEYGFIPDSVAQATLPKIDWIVAVSDYIAQGITSRFPGVKGKTLVSHLGVDTSFFRSKWNNQNPNDSRRVLFVGRIVPEKGLHILLSAFRDVLSDITNATLTIAGTYFGPGDLYSYKKQIESLTHPIQDSIRVTGWCSRSSLPNLYTSCSVCVHPAIWDEPFANVPLEAMSCGLVVIASSTGGTSELITHREDGLLVPPADTDVLSGTLHEILLSPEKQRTIGLKARRTIESNFSWEHNIHRIIERCYPIS